MLLQPLLLLLVELLLLLLMDLLLLLLWLKRPPVPLLLLGLLLLLMVSFLPPRPSTYFLAVLSSECWLGACCPACACAGITRKVNERVTSLHF
jgi:hypothetical protein